MGKRKTGATFVQRLAEMLEEKKHLKLKCRTPELNQNMNKVCSQRNQHINKKILPDTDASLPSFTECVLCFVNSSDINSSRV